MTRKCYNHTLQTNPRHREEETLGTNSRLTSKDYKLITTSSLFPGEVIAKTRKDKKYCTTKRGPNTYPHKTMGATIKMNQQQQYHCLRMDSN